MQEQSISTQWYCYLYLSEMSEHLFHHCCLIKAAVLDQPFKLKLIFSKLNMLSIETICRRHYKVCIF